MHEDLKRFINECNERKKGVETFYFDLETFTVNREAIKQNQLNKNLLHILLHALSF